MLYTLLSLFFSTVELLKIHRQNLLHSTTRAVYTYSKYMSTYIYLHTLPTLSPSLSIVYIYIHRCISPQSIYIYTHILYLCIPPPTSFCHWYGSCETTLFLMVYILDDHTFMDLPFSAAHFGSSHFILAKVLRIKGAPIWDHYGFWHLTSLHCLLSLAVPTKQISFHHSPSLSISIQTSFGSFGHSVALPQPPNHAHATLPFP